VCAKHVTGWTEIVVACFKELTRLPYRYRERQLALTFSFTIVCNTARIQKGYLSLDKFNSIFSAPAELV